MVTIGQVMAVLRRRALVVVGTVVLMSLIALGLFLSLPKSYEATAVVDLSPALAGTSSTSATVSTTTEARIVTSVSVARLAAESLSSRKSPQELIKTVDVSSPLSSEVLDVTFTASSARRAADGANAFAQAYLTYRSDTTQQDLDLREKKVSAEISTLQAQLDKLDTELGQRAATQRSLAQGQMGQLQSQLNDYRTSVSVAGELAGPASPPTSASAPKPSLFLAGGLVGGLLVGVALALVRDRRDDRLRTQSEVQDLTGLPVIANIPSRGRRVLDARSHLSGLLQSRGPEADAYRTVVTTVAVGDHQGAPRSVLLLGVGRESGFSRVPLNLAATYAMQGLTTVLAGTSQATEEAERLLHVRAGDPEVSESFRERLRGPGAVPNLTVLPLGDEVALGATLRANGNSFDAVLRDADVVVVDGANTELASTALILGQLADAAVVMVGVKQTRRAELESALGQLTKVGAVVIGAVLLSKGSRRARRRERSVAAAARTGNALKADVQPDRGNAPARGLDTRDEQTDSGRDSGTPTDDGVEPSAAASRQGLQRSSDRTR